LKRQGLGENLPYQESPRFVGAGKSFAGWYFFGK
jgi:hypothetical protein